MTLFKRKIACLFAIACMISIAGSTSVRAQNEIKNLFGNMLGGALADATKTEWQKLGPEKLQCMQMGLKIKGAPLQNLIQKGIKPNDQRVAGFHKICDDVLNKKLRTDFQCQLKDKQGNTVNTRCNEYLVTVQNGKINRVNKQQAMNAIFNGIQVRTYNKQTQQAAQAGNKKRAAKNQQRSVQRQSAPKSQRAAEASGNFKTLFACFGQHDIANLQYADALFRQILGGDDPNDQYSGFSQMVKTIGGGITKCNSMLRVPSQSKQQLVGANNAFEYVGTISRGRYSGKRVYKIVTQGAAGTLHKGFLED